MKIKKETEERLQKEWSSKKNEISFEEWKNNLNIPVWWECQNGHCWKSRISSRIKKDSQCPYCIGHKAIPGINDVGTLYPNLKEEFNPTKNKDIRLEDYKEFSAKKVWWKCSKGHEWQAVINTRTKRGSQCPICSGKRIVPGINDFKTIYPHIAKEININKNQGIDVGRISGKSSQKIWWICEKGHEYEMSVDKRTVRGYGCPYCSGRRIIIGETDLQTIFPETSLFWDEERNGNIQQFAAHSSKIVSWKCEKGHSWDNRISNQVNYNVCPYCTGKKLVVGVNDVATKYPMLAADWDIEKNNIEPSKVKASTSMSAYWKCNKGHSWRTSLWNRLQGKGCPYCKGKIPIVGETDLLSLFPWVESEWNYELNRKRPEDFFPKSNFKVWWKCKNGHVWKSLISERTRGSGCPSCGGK